MHIPDGVLSMPMLLAGAASAVAGCALGLRRMDPERIPQTALVAAVLFVAALVHFPVGPSSVHLLLGGLAGIMLGWATFPAMLVALLLQAVMFGFGGLMVLGVNVVTMALPAVLCGLVFELVRRRGNRRQVLAAAAAAGGGSVLLSAFLTTGAILVGAPHFGLSAWAVAASALPVAVVEAVFTASAIGLLLKVKPEALGGSLVPAHA